MLKLDDERDEKLERRNSSNENGMSVGHEWCPFNYNFGTDM